MDPITIKLTPRQALALRTGLEQLASLFRQTGNDHKAREIYKPFYDAAKNYSELVAMLPSWTELAKEVRP